MEDQVLQEKFKSFDKSLGEIDDGILSTSFDLFLFYQQTLNDCVTLSTGKVFLDLVKMFQKGLDDYNKFLIQELPGLMYLYNNLATMKIILTIIFTYIAQY